jgi:hypothetical protein
MSCKPPTTSSKGEQQAEPMLGRPATVPADLGQPQTMLADNGHFSAANAAACAAAGIEPLPALARRGLSVTGSLNTTFRRGLEHCLYPTSPPPFLLESEYGN